MSANQFFRFTYACLAILIIFYSMGCQPEEERIVDDPAIHLTFSKDTVLFDTLFVSLGSVTKRLKVYNPRSNAIRLNEVKVAGGADSPFTIYLNGVEGKTFNDLIIQGKDSLLILVEALIDPTADEMPFVVEDSLLFETAGPPQDVKLFAWGQNANFLNDSILSCTSTWDNRLPYVIFNSVLVDSGCTLEISEGARVYFHNGSAMFVAGNLIVKGAPENKVLFTNDRLDEPYQSTPGQWDGIIFLEGSTGNRIDHATIRNSVYGIWLGTPDNDATPDLELTNSTIENISKTGLISFTSDLTAYNVLINNCGEFSMANLAGGNYNYKHITIANMGLTFFRNFPSIAFTDQLELSDGSVIADNLLVEFSNSIIWGNISEELQFDFTSPGSKAIFHHNLLKTEQDTFALNNLVNLDPRFIDIDDANFRIDSLSPAIDAGLPGIILFDIEGQPRDSKPDLGAYEFIKQ